MYESRKEAVTICSKSESDWNWYVNVRSSAKYRLGLVKKFLAYIYVKKNYIQLNSRARLRYKALINDGKIVL